MARVSIEDCLGNIENRFALVTIASHRARQLMDGDQALVRSKNKEAVTALREIAEGYVIQDRSEPPVVETPAAPPAEPPAQIPTEAAIQTPPSTTPTE